jgi:uncharacterized membrane protein
MSSGAKTAIIVVVVLVICSVAGYFVMSQMSKPASQSGQSNAELQATIASLQSQLNSSPATLHAVTPEPQTEAPLCPENYAPVKDINGKIYKNSCYAQSVGAQFAPTPLTEQEAQDLLNGLPSARGAKTTMSPGSATQPPIPNIHDVMNQAFGKPTENPKQQQQQQKPKQQGNSQGSFGPGNTVVVPKPIYAGGFS